MGNFCSKSKISKLNDEESAILQCKMARDSIKTYLKKLKQNSEAKREKAKEALQKKNKERARALLRQAKMFSEQTKSTEKQLEMIEDQVAKIETAQSQRDALKVLQQGNEILKQLNAEVNVEKFEKISDEMDELKAQQDEIGEFFKQRGLNPEEEEEAINNELDQLMLLEGYGIDKELPDAEMTNVDQQKVKEKEEVKNKEAQYA